MEVEKARRASRRDRCWRRVEMRKEEVMTISGPVVASARLAKGSADASEESEKGRRRTIWRG
jgi:hypothetical protein